MSSVISTNITSMIAQQNLNSSKSDLTTAMERLSSGMRINSAKDDAAGQAIANRMSSQITGLSQAQRNANDGISVAQTTEGALNQVNDNLQRIRELTVQAQNGTNSSDDLESIQNEIGQRLNEINRISEETSFNGVKVLQKDNSLQIQVGANDGEAISIDLKQIDAKTLGLEGFNVDGTGETANAAATKTSLTTAGAKPKGDTNEYVIAEANGSVTASSLLDNVKDGDVVRAATTPNTQASYTNGNVADILAKTDNNDTITISGGPAGASGVYTFDSTKSAYTYTETVSTGANAKTALTDALTPTLGEETNATVTLGAGTQPVDIVVDDQGNITDKNGQALYLESTSGNLTLTDNGTGTQATVDDLATALSSNSGSSPNLNGSTVTVGDVTYTTGTNDGSQTVSGQTISTEGMASLIDSRDTTVTIKTGGDTQDITIDGTAKTVQFSGSGTFADGDVYLTGAGALSDQAEPTVTGFDSEYTYSEEKGAFTYSETTSFDGSDPTNATNAIKTLKDAMSPAVGETTTADITIGGNSTKVVIGSDGSLTSAASGNKLYLDGNNNLTETNAAGDAEATTDNVAKALLAEDESSIAIEGGATYTVDNTGDATSTLTAEGLTASASAVADRLDDNANGTFEYVVNDFDGEGNSQTVTLNLDSEGAVAKATFTAGITSDGSSAYVNAEGALTSNATEDTSYFLQENGNVTNASGQRIYEDGEGGFTTEDVTVGDRTAKPLDVLDSALKQVDSLRSDLGAIQNRFDSAITNLSTTETNLSAARSRIEDADYATEVSNMTRAQILQQAGTSVLAQANQVPQSVLSLLG